MGAVPTKQIQKKENDVKNGTDWETWPLNDFRKKEHSRKNMTSPVSRKLTQDEWLIES